jgi:VWFA-related protein
MSNKLDRSLRRSLSFHYEITRNSFGPVQRWRTDRVVHLARRFPAGHGRRNRADHRESVRSAADERVCEARNGRKALLIISDGGDNSSRFTESEVRSWVREGDVQTYAIGIYEQIGARGRTPEELGGPGLLSDLAEQTGGKSFNVENLADLPDVAAKIGLELRNQYVLGYNPKNAAHDGKYRKVEVKLVKVKELPPLWARYVRISPTHKKVCLDLPAPHWRSPWSTRRRAGRNSHLSHRDQSHAACQ